MRVLIAEDTAAVRDAVALIVAADGHDVVTARDGLEAQALFDSGGFDIVILDIWMPGRSGLDVLKAIRSVNPDIPVVIMSGGGPGASLEQATALADLYKATRILFKPFEDDELLEIIRAVAVSA